MTNMIIMSMMTTNFTILFMLNHPISMGSLLIFQTLLTSLIMIFSIKSSWFSMILFISMIGGMMIMFIYMASIISNQKFKFSYNLLLLSMTILSFMMYLKNQNMNNWMNLDKILILETNEQIKSINKFYNFKKMNMLILMILMLFMILITVTFLCSSFKGPLKKTYV
nr:NADH dehydrogenase subunit 6 [Kinnaridae sp.]